METGIETKTDMKTEMYMETETVTENTQTWTWNSGPFPKYFMQHNSPYGAIRIGADISWCNFNSAMNL